MSVYKWKNPIYTPSSVFVMFLVKNSPDHDCWWAYAGRNGVFDVVESNNNIFLYKRSGHVPGLSLIMNEYEMTAITSYVDNPVRYSGKYELKSFLAKIDSYGYR